MVTSEQNRPLPFSQRHRTAYPLNPVYFANFDGRTNARRLNEQGWSLREVVQANTGYKSVWEKDGVIQNVNSPVALDLNRDGRIGTTGESTAKDRVSGTTIGSTVQFDIDADGQLDEIEWMNGDGDGLLVDTSQINGSFLNGNALFGDLGGQFNNGYEKMAGHDANNDGKLAGAELNDLGVWVDDGDAILEDGELRSLDEFGITELSTQKQDVQNDRGETLMQSSAVANGQFMLTEDVWFAKK